MIFRTLVTRAVAVVLSRQQPWPFSLRPPPTLAGTKPNIVIILADDLGLRRHGLLRRDQDPDAERGSPGAGGPALPDAHSTSATCTPARYALLTGEYPWRKKGTGILPGDAELIIQPGRTTVASLLQRAGYRTGVVGKWHLGLGGKGGPDWNGEIKPGPREIGFDYSFLMPATGDRVPCVYVENQRVVGLDPKDPIQVSYGKPVGTEPTGKDHPELLKLHPSHGPRPDHHQRHQPHRLHERRQGGALGGRGHGRHLHPEGRRVHRTEQGQAVLPLLCHA